jgi:hypothetical protein
VTAHERVEETAGVRRNGYERAVEQRATFGEVFPLGGGEQRRIDPIRFGVERVEDALHAGIMQGRGHRHHVQWE